jgi:fermentation-respiration switch protein FrsA (DUF1100 family)
MSRPKDVKRERCSMFQRSSEKGIIFFPDHNLIGTPTDYGLEYEEVWFLAEDKVRLHGWWVPRAGAPVFLWFHGNVGNISYWLENLKSLHNLAEVQVFIFDYREYGKSRGRISRAGTFKDAAAAYRYVTETREVPPVEIILFGRSLGAALATDLAVRVPCRSLIIESGFTSFSDIAKLYAPIIFDWRLRVPYDNLGKIDKLKVPLLIIHGSDDEFIPVEMARRLFSTAKEPKELYIIPGAHHNDTFAVGGRKYFERLRTFIYRLEK